MTREDEFIAQVEGYLDEYEGLTPLPDAVRDAVRAELPTTKQIGPLSGLMRNLNMTMNVPRAARYGLVAAAVVAAVLLGATLIGRGPDVGGEPESTPIPTTSPMPARLSGTELEPGTYRLTVLGTVDATITVPDGWANLDGIGVTKNSDEPSRTAVVFWGNDLEVSQVYADPCQWLDGYVDPPVGPTVDDLATALANQPQRGESLPTEVSIDGYRGKMIELSVPSDIDFADCDRGLFRSWTGRYHQGPGQVDRIYIIDVDGQRLVFFTNFLPGTSEADRAEGQAIVDSIQLDEP